MPKETQSSEKTSEIKSSNELAADLIKQLLEDSELKSKIFNLDDIKNKIDAENKGPYQNVFLQEIEYMNALLGEIVK